MNLGPRLLINVTMSRLIGRMVTAGCPRELQRSPHDVLK